MASQFNNCWLYLLKLAILCNSYFEYYIPKVVHLRT